MLEGLKSWVLNGATFEARSSAPSAPTSSPAAAPGSAAGKSSTSVIPTPITPKVGNAPLTTRSYLTTAKPSPTSALQRVDRGISNLDITTYRSGSDTRQVIRDFTRSSPDLSAAITAYVRTGITTRYTAIARNPDGTVMPEATNALAQILTRLNVLNDYSVGFDDHLSIRGLSEVWARELITQGAMCAELVLDAARLPDKIVPISTSQISFFPSADATKTIPHQILSGVDIPLDVPTFFYVKLDEDILSAYPVSPIEPAIQSVIFSADFMNDIRKIVKRSIHPRIVVTIDEELFMQYMPEDIKNDQTAATAYKNSVIADVQSQVSGLAPEDALVLFSSLTMEMKDHGNTQLSSEYKVLQDLIDAKLAAGAKTLPTILGHSNGTSNVASAETMLFLKLVEGSVWSKLNEMFSKVLTLSVRLLGYDVYVEFAYATIELKPESELEAFRAMELSRLRQLWSDGAIDGNEYCIRTTGHMPPATFVERSGTGFMDAPTAAPAGDGYNGASNSGSALNQSLKPTTPTSPKNEKKS